MQLVALVLILLGQVIATVFVVNILIKIDQEERKREERLKKWLFDSFYNINKATVLPESPKATLINKKAEVINPAKDPMREFDKGLDDWFGDEND